MCIAIYKPAGKEISDEILKTCRDNNKDGCGFAYINEDKFGVKRIKIKKSMDYDVFLRQYKRAIQTDPDSPFLIHFRIATHGEVSKFNCHPFSVENDTVFVHNGVISDVSKDQRKSDTQMFNEEILKDLHPDDLVYNDTIKRLLEEFIGWNSKLIFMNVEGDIQICHEKKGNWQEGIWYSNMSWKPKAKTTYNSSKTNTYKSQTKYPRIPYSTRVAHKSIYSFEQCDQCGDLHQINVMNPYRCTGDMVIFCAACTEKGMERYSISAFDSVRPYQFVEHLNTTYDKEHVC